MNFTFECLRAYADENRDRMGDKALLIVELASKEAILERLEDRRAHIEACGLRPSKALSERCDKLQDEVFHLYDQIV